MTKPHEPTPKALRQVYALSRYGVPQDAICAAIEVSLPTLHKYYRNELDRGMAAALMKLGKALFERAVVDRDTAALIFLGKTRLGLKETSRVESTGADGGAIKVEESPRERVNSRLARLKVVGGTDQDTG